MRRPTALATVAAAAGLAALAAGCGNPGGDLLAIEVRESTTAGGPIRHLVVTDDGRGRCNAGELERLPSERLLEAREVHRDLTALAARGARFESGPRGRRSFRAQLRDGTVTWIEGARGAPPAIARASLLGLRLRRELC